MQTKILFIFLVVFYSFNSQAQEIVDAYINEYQYIAVKEMERTGIPASIKLAQGLLESDWGRSELSQFGHNHFGIKCGSNWEGTTYYKVDDDYGENGELTESCFRVFESDEASYIAHSEFLLSNKRYAELFEYDETDYKAWAKGLRKAGYATDPSYPSKLIGIINKYDLSRFDYMASDELNLLAKAHKNDEDALIAYEDVKKETRSTSSSKNTKEKSNSKLADATASIENDIKDFTKNFQDYKKKWNSNSSYENKRTNPSSSREKSNFSFESILAEVTAIGDKILGNEASNEEAITSLPDLSKHNGVAMVLSETDETLADIAVRTGIRIDVLKINNEGLYERDQVLPNGTTIYLEAKKSSYTGSRKTHQVVAGEKVATISQRYGVTESSLRKRNYLSGDEEVKHGEILYLQGIRKIKKPKLAVNKVKEDVFLFESESK